MIHIETKNFVMTGIEYPDRSFREISVYLTVKFFIYKKMSREILGELFAHQEDADTWHIGYVWNENAPHEHEEAFRKFCSFLFEEKNARRIYTFISEKDIYSLELCQNIKMRQEGHFIEFTPLEKNTEYVPDYDNIYLYAMLQREWQ